MKPPSAISRTIGPLALAIGLACAANAHAQSSSDPSEGSLVPGAMSVALPIVLVAGVGAVVVTGIETSAEGSAWIVENTVDGAKGSISFTGRAVGVSAIAVGTVITVTAVGAGLVLSAAGRVVAFIPNEVGKSLLYNERVSR